MQLTSITKARYKFLSESEVQMEVGSFRYRNRLIGVRCLYYVARECDLRGWKSTFSSEEHVVETIDDERSRKTQLVHET